MLMISLMFLGRGEEKHNFTFINSHILDWQLSHFFFKLRINSLCKCTVNLVRFTVLASDA